MKKISLITIIIALAMNSFADRLSKDTVITMATNFYRSLTKDTLSSYKISNIDYVKLNDSIYLYGINFEKGGYVLASASKNAIPVLSYSTIGAFKYEMLTEGTKALVDGYADINKQTIENSLQNKRCRNMWQSYRQSDFDPDICIQRFPLMEETQTSLWTGAEPYFNKTEFNSGIGSETCVPLSFSQYVKYYQWPVKAKGLVCYDYYNASGVQEYETLTGEVIDYNQRNHTYNYDLMPYAPIVWEVDGVTQEPWDNHFVVDGLEYDDENYNDVIVMMNTPQIQEMLKLQFDMAYNFNYEPDIGSDIFGDVINNFTRLYDYNRNFTIINSSLIDPNSINFKQTLRSKLNGLDVLLFNVHYESHSHIMILDGYLHNPSINVTFFHFVTGSGCYNGHDPRHWFLYSYEDIGTNFNAYPNSYDYNVFIDLLPDNTPNQYEIENNITWDNEKFDVEDVIVESGATLTINSTIHMKPNKKITVEEGGRLVINNNGKITCDNDMWEGIYLDGIECLSNNNPNKCRASIYGGTIENANIGINSEKGGVIVALHSNFINNYTSIYYLNTSKIGNDIQDASRIKQNNFIINDNYLASTTGQKFISVTGNDLLLHIAGNKFENTSTSIIGTGVYGNRAFLDISSTCNITIPVGTECPEANTVRNEFIGLEYGVNVGGPYLSGLVVNNNIFTNNYKAIRVCGTTTATITKNYFESIAPSNGVYDNAYGIYLDQTTNYTVEENIINSGTGAGIYINHSGDDANQVYNNNINYLQNSNLNATAIVASGSNSNFIAGDEFQDGLQGLEIKCNDFSNSNYAIGIVNGNIQKTQGIAGGASNQLTGNTFDHYDTQEDCDFVIDVAETVLVYNFSLNEYVSIPNPDKIPNYFYNQHQNPSSVPPFTELEEYADIINVETYGTYDDNACPSNLTGGGVAQITVSEMQTQTAQIDAEISTEVNFLAQKVDNGNTAILLSEVENANTYNFAQVSYKLIQTEGYISDTVTKEYIRNSVNRPFTKALTLISISPLPYTARAEVEQSNLYPVLKYIISMHQNGTNIREEKESQIAGNKAKTQLLIRDALRTALNDTINRVDSLIDYLDNRDEINNRYTLVSLQMKQKRYQEMLDELKYLSDIKNNYPEQKQKEIEDFVNLQYINIDIKKNYNMFDSIIAQKIDFLNSVANDSSSFFQTSAWSLLEQAGFKEKYREIVKLPNPVVGNKSIAIESLKPMYSKHNGLEPLINIFPNPADDYITVQYAMLEIGDRITINIVDMQGKTLKTIYSENQIDEIIIDINDLPRATYNVQFVSAKQGHYTVKIIKK